MFPNLGRTEFRLRQLADLHTEIRTSQAKSLELIAELDRDDAAWTKAWWTSTTST